MEDIKLDGRKSNGGPNRGGGRKKGKRLVSDKDKKQTVPFQVKAKHVEKAKLLIQPIVDEINSG